MPVPKFRVLRKKVRPVSDIPGPALWNEIEAPRWQPNRTAWLLTCVDLTSLLVGFFVLLFSTQTLQRDKWQAVTGSFQAQFAQRATVVGVVPDGVDNAVVRVTGIKSGVGYLDSLLHQRLQGDAVWSGLVAEHNVGGTGDVVYAVPLAARNADSGEALAAWERMGSVVRGWKNNVGVRVNVKAGEEMAGARTAALLAEKLSSSGAIGAFGEVRVGDNQIPVELVVRSQ